MLTLMINAMIQGGGTSGEKISNEVSRMALSICQTENLHKRLFHMQDIGLIDIIDGRYSLKK